MTKAPVTYPFPSTTAHPSAPSRNPVRIGTTLVLAGVLVEYAVTSLHPAHAAPNDHHAAFAEYAASGAWIPVHLGQFAAGLVIIMGVIALLSGLRETTRSPLVIQAGKAAAVLTAAVSAVLQAVDGIALKHAVDSLATVPAQLRDAAFHDAETIRWVEWSMAAYFRMTLGLTLLIVGVAVLRSHGLPRWTAAFALVAGAAFIVDGVGVGYSGFTGAGAANLVSWASFVIFAVTTTAAAWLHRPDRARPVA